jgi:hypothetical protein
MRTYAFVALAFTTVACSADQFHQPDTSDAAPGNAVSGGDGGTAPDGSDSGIAPGIDAVYVSSSMGSATGDGTQAKPLSSLDTAIAKAGNLPVYACAETYDEVVHFVNGVNVFGDYACNAGWTKSTAHAKIAPKTSPAAFATNITSATHVEAVDIVAPDFTDQSKSSIALVANNAPALTIAHATIHAGTGGNGDDGAAAIVLKDSGSAKNGKNARSADVCTGGIGHCISAAPESLIGGANTCSGESGHDPGPGGDGGWDGDVQSTYNGVNFTWSWALITASSGGFPTVQTLQTTQGGTTTIGPNDGVVGSNGSDGVAGGAFGSADTNGYVPADGTAGTAGEPGLSGGGAAGFAMSASIADPYATVNQNRYARGEAGASGGAGGCPGLAGGAGKGGGASIAILAIKSPLTLDTTVIESSTGGAGGAAGMSSTNTSGGLGGTSVKYTYRGANGGAGGLAGISGNGGGGPSIAIAYQGTAPQPLASNLTHGNGGAGVATRTDNATNRTILATPSGTSSDTYAF